MAKTSKRVQDVGPAYEIIERDGEPARLYPDGSLRDEKGGFLERPPGANVFDSETGLQAARNRWERKREEFAQGVVQGVIEGAELPDNTGSAEAWREIAAHAAKIFLKTDNARGLAELGRFLGEHSGFTPSRTNINATQINLNSSAEDILSAMLNNPVLAPFAAAILRGARRALELKEGDEK